MKLLVQPNDGIAPLLAAVKGAKKSVDILIFRMDWKDLEAALKAAVGRGIAVRALIAHTNQGGAQSLRSLEMRFLEAGVTVMRTADDLVRYHGKMMIIDLRTLYLLSFNFVHMDIDHSRGFGIVTKSAKVVVLTAADRDEDIIAALREGAHAIVQKSSAAETLREAIRAVAGGVVWIPATLRRRLTSAKFAAVSSELLTARESEIVRYVAVGLRNAEVAQRLAITEGTVKIHLNNIFGKLDVRDRVQLTLYALRTRLITLE